MFPKNVVESLFEPLDGSTCSDLFCSCSDLNFMQLLYRIKFRYQTLCGRFQRPWFRKLLTRARRRAPPSRMVRTEAMVQFSWWRLWMFLLLYRALNIVRRTKEDTAPGVIARDSVAMTNGCRKWIALSSVLDNKELSSRSSTFTATYVVQPTYFFISFGT